MRESLIKELEAKGCQIEDKYHKCIYNINQDSRRSIQYILEQNGYEIIEPRSSETTIHFRATSELFKNIAKKYDLDDFFQMVQYWGEIAHQGECSMMGSGEVLSIAHNDSGFHFSIDCKEHKIKTLHFGDERVIKDYNGKKYFIDEMKCNDADKLILENIWQLNQETEEIRLLPSNQPSKKVVQYRKALKKWTDFMSALSKYLQGSKFVFGKIYSIEREIEFWEGHIRKETRKMCL